MEAFDDVIRKLLGGGNGKRVSLSNEVIGQLCAEAKKIFLSQPNLLRLTAPITICGDIRGHFQDLLRIFRIGGYPPDSAYLFLGNYIDLGKQSVETVCLLLAYKVRYPDKMFLLRGNHEDAKFTNMYKLSNECRPGNDYGPWDAFEDCFDCLPFAAVVQDKIFCVHGGLSPELHRPEVIDNIARPISIPDHGILYDLLWSDPHPRTNGWSPSKRGVPRSFGPDNLLEFLRNNDLEFICRAHQVVGDGYEFFAKRRLVTIFSAPNYRGGTGGLENAGALMLVDESLKCSFEILNPEVKSLKNSIEKPSNMINLKEMKFSKVEKPSKMIVSKEVKPIQVEKPSNMIDSKEKQAVDNVHRSSNGSDDQILDEFMGIDLSDFSTWDAPKESLVVADHGSSAQLGSGEAAYEDALKQLLVLRTADFSSSVPMAAIHDSLVAITKALEFQDLSHGRATALRSLQLDLLPVASQLFSHCQAMKPLKEAVEAIEQQSTDLKQKKELLEERNEALKRKKKEYVAKDLELNRRRAEFVRLEEEVAELKASVDRDLSSVRAINNEVLVGFTELKKAKAALPTYRKQLAEEETAVEEHSRRLSLMFDVVEDL